MKWEGAYVTKWDFTHRGPVLLASRLETQTLSLSTCRPWGSWWHLRWYLELKEKPRHMVLAAASKCEVLPSSGEASWEKAGCLKVVVGTSRTSARSVRPQRAQMWKTALRPPILLPRTSPTQFQSHPMCFYKKRHPWSWGNCECGKQNKIKPSLEASTISSSSAFLMSAPAVCNGKSYWATSSPTPEPTSCQSPKVMSSKARSGWNYNWRAYVYILKPFIVLPISCQVPELAK